MIINLIEFLLTYEDQMFQKAFCFVIEKHGKISLQGNRLLLKFHISKLMGVGGHVLC